ncbi:hypothetical protein [Schaalia sp. lx-260]|uniref:hypothetical protein n=1 Tax=Schaalia sp. lx-260 TaxID=2899082 RepID=UPI001E2ADFCB|nr:hypothetical protein [Schaalia sp. lx-260]MCD4549672.1 hypothetical protein [Schaalia sp. lx-260]
MSAVTLTVGTQFNSEVFHLSGQGGLHVETGVALRGYATSYQIEGQSLKGVSRPAREIQLPVKGVGAAGAAEIERLMRAASLSLDVAPSLLSVDGWEQSCHIPKIQVDRVTPAISGITLTLVLLDGYWVKQGAPISVLRASASETSLDYPYDYPHDLASHASQKHFGDEANPYAATHILPLIRIYGPATNPAITIGSNTYRVTTDIPRGAYLTIDPRARTVILTAENGVTTNVFNRAERGSGAGSGNYIFQPLPLTRLLIAYSGEFDFEIIPYYRRQHLW